MDIEKLATSAVEDCIAKSDFMIPDINKGDKVPSWDGFIYVYSDKQHKKENLYGRIPTQVKGHISKDSNATCQHNVEISDLQNYKSEGCAYFVVLIGENGVEKNIFYNLFYPMDIKQILANTSNKKSINTAFVPIPTQDDLYNIFTNFINDCIKQTSFANTPTLAQINISQVLAGNGEVNFTVTVKDNKPSTLFHYILSNSQYIYKKAPDSNYPDIPIGKTKFKNISADSNENVSINGVNYFDKFKVNISLYETVLSFGGCLNITIRNDKCHLDLKMDGSLDSQIAAVKFTIGLGKHKACLLGTKKLLLKNDYPIDTSQLNERLQILLKLKEALNTLHVKEDLLVIQSEFRKYHQSVIELLTGIMVDKNKFDLKNWSNFQQISISLFNLYLPLIFIRQYDGKKDILINKCGGNEFIGINYSDGNIIQVPCCAFMDSDDYKKTNTIYYKNIFNSLTSCSLISPHQIEWLERAYNCMLLAYDETKNKELLKLCMNLSKWMLDNCTNMPIENRRINYIQIIKRKRELSSDEKSLIIDISKNNPSQVILISCLILLDDIKKAEEVLPLIDNKEDFKKLPINFFFKNDKK